MSDLHQGPGGPPSRVPDPPFLATLSIGSLFSGIGGLELGLERGLRSAGIGAVTRWQCEIEEYPRRVLAKHWPAAHRYTDVRAMCRDEEVPHVDLICGGFPCQDLSYAGNRAGLAGARSGLFWELDRIVRVVGPRYVVLENVPGLLTADGGEAMGAVLGALAEGGYDAEWDCIPAEAIGAPQLRDRIFVVAYHAAHGSRGEDLSHGSRLHRQRRERQVKNRRGGCEAMPGGSWAGEAMPVVWRVDDGLPNWVDRLRALGNAVVPQVAEVIGRWVAALELQRLGTP